jgi:hypothetical protein
LPCKYLKVFLSKSAHGVCKKNMDLMRKTLLTIEYVQRKLLRGWLHKLWRWPPSLKVLDLHDAERPPALPGNPARPDTALPDHRSPRPGVHGIEAESTRRPRQRRRGHPPLRRLPQSLVVALADRRNSSCSARHRPQCTWSRPPPAARTLPPPVEIPEPQARTRFRS